MIGNDIIDLKKAQLESNWRRKGYLDKVFTPIEQALIHNSNAPTLMVWKLWSMKEAVYKVVNRMSRERFYHPLSFKCQSKEYEVLGSVEFDGQVFSTRTVVRKSSIHTLASLQLKILFSFKTIFLDHNLNYASQFNSSSAPYLLNKDEFGLPHLVSKKNGKHYLASVSHHGKYLAIIYSKSLRINPPFLSSKISLLS